MVIVTLLTGVVLAVWTIEFFQKNDQQGEISKSAVDRIAGAFDRWFK